MKKLILPLIILFALLFSSCDMPLHRSAALDLSPSRIYLLMGVDEAASNTDAMALLLVSDGTATVLRIPRDTYFRHRDGDKINSVFPRELAAARGNYSTAMRETEITFSKALGVPIDGTMIINGEGIVRGIDAVGGVEIDLPEPVAYEDSDGVTHTLFSAGKQRLMGKDALRFLRFRAGYADADLGRIDAQRIFADAFVTGLTGSRTAAFFTAIAPYIHTDVGSAGLLKLAMELSRSGAVEHTLLPGEAVTVTADGAVSSYYVIYRSAAIERMSGFPGFSGTLDPLGIMTSEGLPEINEIYTKDIKIKK